MVTLVKRSQAVLNALARLVTGTRRSDHITPVLTSLHWLSYHNRIKYKVRILTYRCQPGLAPNYLASSIRPVAVVPGRSSDSFTSLGLLWGSARFLCPHQDFLKSQLQLRRADCMECTTLLIALRDSSLSLSYFKSKLKTHLCLMSTPVFNEHTCV